MEKPDEGSIEGIAMARWGEYHGDIVVMHYVEKIHGEEAHNMVTHALQANFVEGFRQGVLLRLTGDTNAHG